MNKKALFAIIVIAASLIAALLYCNRVDESSVQRRLSIDINYPKNNLIKPDKNLETTLKEKIPEGTLLRFFKNGELSIKPDVTGNRGLFFHLQ